MSDKWPVAAAAVIMVILTNGPVLLFSKRILDRTGRWEDLTVWPFFVAAACASAMLASSVLRRRDLFRPDDAVASATTPGSVATRSISQLAAVAVACYSLVAVASSLWSVDSGNTLWRSLVYSGLALLAVVVAGFSAGALHVMLAMVTAVTVAGSLLLLLLRPDIGIDVNGAWRGLYTTRNSLAPLAALGVIAGTRALLTCGGSPHGDSDIRSINVRALLTCGGSPYCAAWRVSGGVLVVMSATAMFGTGSRTAWLALFTSVCAATALAAYRLLLSRHSRRGRSDPRGRSRRSAITTRAAAESAGVAAVHVAVVALAVAVAAAIAAWLWHTPTLAQRRTIWRLVWERILERPIGGYGFSVFWDDPGLTAAHELLRRGSAHNSLMETGLGLGLLGVAPFIVIALLAVWNAGRDLWNHPSADTWMWAAVVGVVIVENISESFVLWFSYNWVLLMAAAMRSPVLNSAALPSPALNSAVLGLSSGRFFIQTRAMARRSHNELGRAYAVFTRSYARTQNSARAFFGMFPSWLWSGWTAVALICSAVLVLWLPDLNLPLGNSDDGRILGRFGLQARNFWELGPIQSRLGASIEPFREPFALAYHNIVPHTPPPTAAVTYAHHPPLLLFSSIASFGFLGDSPTALRVTGFILGSATAAFMASVLRVRGMAWGPTLLAVSAMVSTGFFYVYGRIGASFSLLLAATAMVAWLREAQRPSRRALAGVAALAALTAMQSWIAMGTTALLILWLLAARMRTRLAAGCSPALLAVVSGLAIGIVVTAAWMLNATDMAELGRWAEVRFSNEVGAAKRTVQFGFGEFLERQWAFANEEMLAPLWLRALLLPALIVGLVDRRTRVPTAITLTVAAAWTFGFPQGAWVHRLWNFPWLAPFTIGLAAVADALRRLLPRILRAPAATLATAVVVATLFAVATGSTRDRYLAEPAEAGAVVERIRGMEAASTAQGVWAARGIPTPRWISYYLDLPVWPLDESSPDFMKSTDLVMFRSDMTPTWFPDGVGDDPLAESGIYRMIAAATLME